LKIIVDQKLNFYSKQLELSELKEKENRFENDIKEKLNYQIISDRKTENINTNSLDDFKNIDRNKKDQFTKENFLFKLEKKKHIRLKSMDVNNPGITNINNLAMANVETKSKSSIHTHTQNINNQNLLNIPPDLNINKK
jgi:hypothetical protein